MADRSAESKGSPTGLNEASEGSREFSQRCTEGNTCAQCAQARVKTAGNSWTFRLVLRERSGYHPSSMTTARRLHHSYEEYLRLLELSPARLEYCDGEIFAMAGGTPLHADLSASAIRILGNDLLGKCRVSSSDLKVRIEATDLSTFPDVTVVCGERQVSTLDENAIVNPTVLVEVTSRSTEDYDRGEKLSHYKQIPSLRAVLYLSHKRAQVTVVERADDSWTVREARAGERVSVASIGLELAVDELYQGLKLEAGI